MRRTAGRHLPEIARWTFTRPFFRQALPVYKPHLRGILPAPMAILLNFVLVIFLLVALLMILVILMQRPKSEGLGAAFGGGMTDNLFGAQTTNVLTKITGWLAGIFFTLTFLLSIMYAHRTNSDSSLRRELMKTQANAPAAVPVTPTNVANSPAPAGAVAGPAPPNDNVGAAPAASAAPADLAVGAVVPPAASGPISSPAASARPRP